MPFDNALIKVSLLWLLYRWGDKGLERLSNFPKATHLPSDKAEMLPRYAGFQTQCSSTTMLQ